MVFTSQLKLGVDLPVWEWCRNLPTATSNAGPSTFATGGKPFGRFIYHFPSGTSGSQRYDTYTDSWNILATPVYAQTTVASTRYNDYHGYYGRVISSPSLSSVEIGIPTGNKIVGEQIKIISGTGAGQTRIIKEVKDPVVADTMVVTTGSNANITDSNKNYPINQYRDYIVRIIGNTNTDFRKIVRNFTNSVIFADNQFSAYGVRWAYSALPYTTSTTAGSQTIAQIESTEIVVDTDWDVQPDSTSQFVIRSGGLWNVNVAANRFALQYYDVLADCWYAMSSPAAGLLNGNLATDVAIETLNESAVGMMLSATTVTADLSSITLSSVSLTPDQYSGYIVRVMTGTGIGQDRLIISNTSDKIIIGRSWSTTPDNTSTIKIVSDNDKMYLQGGGIAAMLEYDNNNDVWSDSRIIEAGCPNNLCAIWAGHNRPVGITSITRVGTTATVTTVLPHGLRAGETVTIRGATDSLYNITANIDTAPSSTTFTYTMASTPSANAVAAASQTTTLLVDPSKNWTPNSLVGKVVTYSSTAFTATGGFQQNLNHRYITANTTTTITLGGGTVAPTAGSTVYYITDLRCNGGILADTVAAGSSTTVINLATGGLTTNLYAGRRVIIKDGANWAEAAIASNTASSITVAAALSFTPAANAMITILGNGPTGAGNSLEYLYNTTTRQKGRYVFAVRGGATNHMMLYDITTNQWQILGQLPNAETFTTGSMTAYDGDDRVYIQRDVTGRIIYYNFLDNLVYGGGVVPYGMGTATLGNKMAIIKTQDGVKFLYLPRHTGSEFWRCLLFW